jgi:hypothetical protein
MVYPRACPSCGANEPSPEQLYSTRAAINGGTPSPWRPEQPIFSPIAVGFVVPLRGVGRVLDAQVDDL